jgi:hypothetical protein
VFIEPMRSMAPVEMLASRTEEGRMTGVDGAGGGAPRVATRGARERRGRETLLDMVGGDGLEPPTLSV